ncbi:hypothetical protein F4779DRAFT_579574 [Xylariaceae sp. FL0662B]|nr:hypothetical protein F4779DRAFT_579574 [Xylariaceae sp. FL0662B]
MSLAQISQLPQAEQETIFNGPALEPPGDIVPELDNPPHNNDLAIAVTILCLSISVILVLIRVYSRVFVMKHVRVEDFVGLAAFGNYAAYMYCVFRFLRNTGFFVHQWNVRLKKLPEFLYIILIGSNFYAVNIMCIKVAIMLEWLRVFVPGRTRNTFYWSCWAVLIVNTTYYIANVVAINLTCIPYQAIWDITMSGKCLNQKALDTSSAIINLVSDLVIMGLAQQVIWRLQMSIKKRLGVSLIFAAGIFGCIAGCFRLAVTVQYQKDKDLTYSVSSVIMWAIGEMTAGFLVFCVPAAPKAFNNIRVTARIASAWESWISIPSGGTGSFVKGVGSWQPNLAGSTGPYHNIQADQLHLMNLALDPQSSFKTTDNLRGYFDSPTNGIVRTTQLVTTLQRDNHNMVAREEYSRQHPWTAD